MCKLLFTVIVLLFVCGNTFSQTKNNILEDLSSKKICYVEHFDSKHLSRHLKMHERRFKRKWKKYHILLGKSAIHKIFDNMERFYVLRYEVEHTDSVEILLRPSKKAVSDMFFVYDNFYLGDYCYGRCKTLTHRRIHSDYRNTLNYGVVSGHYTCYHIDKSVILDFFEKGFPVFSADICADVMNDGMDVWFSTNEYDNPIIFKKSDIWKIVLHYDSNSEFKSKFY